MAVYPGQGDYANVETYFNPAERLIISINNWQIKNMYGKF